MINDWLVSSSIAVVDKKSIDYVHVDYSWLWFKLVQIISLKMIITNYLHFIIFDYVSIWTDLENHSDTAMLALQERITTAIAPAWALGPVSVEETPCGRNIRNSCPALATVVLLVECCPMH